MQLNDSSFFIGFLFLRVFDTDLENKLNRSIIKT